VFDNSKNTRTLPVARMGRTDYAPVIVDNLVNSKVSVLERLTAITGIQYPFHRLDLRDRTALETVFQKYSITAVIHFAGLKAVGESVDEPLLYYDNNLQSTLSLCEIMKTRGGKTDHVQLFRHGLWRAAHCPHWGGFSSGSRQSLRSLQAYDRRNPSGSVQSRPDLEDWPITLLQPRGCPRKRLIGEDPQGIPNNLMLYIS
jgi:UDP-glucose 4-epimerase